RRCAGDDLQARQRCEFSNHSSVSPSEKYSWAGSLERFLSGRTAIERTGLAAPARRICTSPAMAIATITAASPAITQTLSRFVAGIATESSCTPSAGPGGGRGLDRIG